MKKMKIIGTLFVLFAAILVFSGLISCEKSESILQNPYAGGKGSFNISFSTSQEPIPEMAYAGDTVTFFVKGLAEYQGQFDFYINNELVEVIEITESTAKVLIPLYVSSGLVSVVLNKQVFFGPQYRILGNIRLDPNFDLETGVSGPVYDFNLLDDQFLVVGSFNNIDGADGYFNNIGFISKDGQVNTIQTTGKGSNLPIRSVSRLSTGRFIISGFFDTFFDAFTGSGYSAGNSKPREVGGITRLKPDGSMDVKYINNLINLTPDVPSNAFDTVPNFVGEFPDQYVLKSIVTPDDNIIAVGSLNTYAKIDYTKSTRQTRFYNYTEISSIVKMDATGNLNLSYHTNHEGANGTITDACLLSSGEVLLVGDFTSFDGISAGRMVKLDLNGNVTDMNIGEGANGRITSINYNAAVEKLMIVGNFTNFNGRECQGIAMLNTDGSFDDEFSPKLIEGGSVTFAQLLNIGKIILSGTFKKYDEVNRSSFLLLERDGSASQDYNVPGSFEGQIYKVTETTSPLGNPALVLAGFIRKFDDQDVGNFVRVELIN